MRSIDKEKKRTCDQYLTLISRADDLVSSISDGIRWHIRLQRHVVIFNKSFSCLFIVGVPLDFLMILFLSYSIIKMEFRDVSTFYLYVGNAISFLLRAFLQLYFHGQVQSAKDC